MASLEEQAAKIEELISAEAAREQRDIAQDAVTQAQIVTLTQAVADLQATIAGGALSPANQALVDASVTKLQATIDSLNAADPTAPVV